MDALRLILLSDGERLLLARVKASDHRGNFVEAIYLLRGSGVDGFFSQLLEGIDIEAQLLEPREG